jgi:predicted nucleotidyltransferase
MMTAEDRKAITEIAERYGVRKLLLFGSSIDTSHQARDIDLAVEGLAPERFFDFFGDLIFGVSMPIDLIDLSSDTKFNRIVREEGILLYGTP